LLNPTKGGEIKMKNKTIFVVLCVVLLLLFTSLSYGWWDKPRPQLQALQLKQEPPPHQKARLRQHPWDHCLSPRIPDDTIAQVEVSVFLIPFSFDAPMLLRISKNLSFDIPDNKDVDH